MRVERLVHAAAHAQLEDLALDRAHRRAGAVRRQRRAPGAGGDHHGAALDRPRPSAHAGHAPAVVLDRLAPRRPSSSSPTRRGERARRSRAGRPGRRRARGSPPAMRGDRPGSSRRQRPGASHSTSRPERALELVQAAQLLGVVAVGGHDQRAAVAVAGRQPAALLQLGGERGPALARRRGSRAAARSSPKSASVTGASMPAATPRGAGARRGRAVEHEHGQPALAGAPRAGEADQSGTDHDGVVACAPRQLNLLPFAGITRVRFDGRRRRSRPLSPVSPSSRWAPQSLHLLSIPPPTAPQLSKRVLLRDEEPERAVPVRRSLPSCHETTDDHNRHARRCRRRRADGPRLQPAAADHARRRPGALGARARRSPSSPTSAPTSSRSTSTGTRSLRRAGASRAASTAPIPPATHGAATTPPSRAILAQGMQPYLSLGGHAPALGHRAARARAGHDAPEREGVPHVRPGRRRSTTRASTSGRSGTSPTSTLGSARSAARARRCRRRSTATSTWPATAGSAAPGHRGDTILLGELMPRGGTSPRKVRPLEFLREMACLDRHYRQIRGSAAKKRGCRKIGRFPTSGIAYHPYTPPAGPHVARGHATTPRSASCPRLRSDDRRARAARQAAAPPADLDHRVRLPDQAARPDPARR